MKKLLDVGPALPLLLVGACSSTAEPFGQVDATVVIPERVACVRLQVAGSQTVELNVDVLPGETTLVREPRAPVGADTVTASGFDLSCTSLSIDQPIWVSDAVAGTVTAGEVTSLALPMHPVELGSKGR